MNIAWSKQLLFFICRKTTQEVTREQIVYKVCYVFPFSFSTYM